MHIKSLILFALVTILISCSSGGSSDSDGGTGGTGVKTVSGTILNQSGQPIKDVKVESADGLGSALSDVNGNYSFEIQTTANEIELIATNAGNVSSITLSGLQPAQLQLSLDLQYLNTKLIKVAGTATDSTGTVALGVDQIRIDNGDSTVEIDPDGGISVGSNNGGVTVDNDGGVTIDSDNGNIIVGPDGNVEINLP